MYIDILCLDRLPVNALLEKNNIPTRKRERDKKKFKYTSQETGVILSYWRETNM